MVNKRQGIGAKCTVLKKNLHPKKRINERYINFAKESRLEGLVAIRQEKKKIRGKDQLCIVFHHEDFPNEEVYCATRWAKVTQEGPDNCYFEVPEVPVEEVADPEEEVTPVPNIPKELFNRNHRIGHREDIELFWQAGFGVDDDNEPAPENVPTAGALQEQDLNGGIWG
jgi:hypothetical protein